MIYSFALDGGNIFQNKNKETEENKEIFPGRIPPPSREFRTYFGVRGKPVKSRKRPSLKILPSRKKRIPRKK